MTKWWPILILILSLIGCSTSVGVLERNEYEGPLSLLDITQYPSNVYVGLSGPYSTKEKMVEVALMSCAKGILLEEALALDSRFVMREDSDKGLTSFALKEHAYYDDTSLAKVIEELTIISITFEKDAGAIVCAEYGKKEKNSRALKVTLDSFGKPTWLKNYPTKEGYLFGVGNSKSYYYLNDSLEASDFAAAQNILDLYSEHLFSTSIETNRVGSENSMDRAVYQAQRGLLQGFRIVDRYYDKEEDTYWSLASIRE